MRSGACTRRTTETSVSVTLSLEGTSERRISTGVAMLDHMLAQWAFYARVSLVVEASSLDRIQHHVVEDVAIALGRACAQALGERRNINRFSTIVLPMDDALVRCSLDFGGRPFARIDLGALPGSIEDLASPMIAHVFTTFAMESRCALHVDRLAGTDPHHTIEAAFKALGCACRHAWQRDGSLDGYLSTKGTLV